MEYSVFECVKEGDLPSLVKLYSQGANLNARCDENHTPLIWATIRGYDEIVEFLLENGADPFATDSKGENATTYAAFCGHYGIVLRLQRFGVPLTMMGASILGDTNRVGELIRAGADPNRIWNSGYTPFLLAAYNGRTETALKLIELGADANARMDEGNALYVAARNGQEDMVRTLVNLGLDVNSEGL